MDENGVYFPSDISGPNDGQYVYEIVNPETNIKVKMPSRGWVCPKEKLEDLIKNGLVHFGEKNNSVPNLKTYLKNTEYQSLTSIKFVDGRASSKRLKLLFGEKIFTNPKDEILLKSLFKSLKINGDDIVMDFFAGSASTAHAVFKLNKEFSSNCRTILVQLPEDLNKISKSSTGLSKKTTINAIRYLNNKKRPLNISEIGKERLRLAKEIEGTFEDEIDLGFKVFKLDATNINPWQADFDNIEAVLDNSVDSIKSDRTAEDVLYEILLKYGLDLTLPIEEHSIAGKIVFSVGMGVLLVCLDDEIPLEVAKGIGELKEKLQPEVMRVVFKDAGFADDVVKTNTLQILKQFGIDDVKSI